VGSPRGTVKKKESWGVVRRGGGTGKSKRKDSGVNKREGQPKNRKQTYGARISEQERARANDKRNCRGSSIISEFTGRKPEQNGQKGNAWGVRLKWSKKEKGDKKSSKDNLGNGLLMS